MDHILFVQVRKRLEQEINNLVGPDQIFRQEAKLDPDKPFMTLDVINGRSMVLRT